MVKKEDSNNQTCPFCHHRAFIDFDDKCSVKIIDDDLVIEHEDSYEELRTYIFYCPMCGRKL